jgi:hypothetical protein
MSARSAPDAIAVVTVSVLLILTALGNAAAMLAGSLIAIVALMLLFPKDSRRGGVLVATIGAAVSFVSAIVMLMFLG